VEFAIGSFHLHTTPVHFINDVLMAIFFLLVGLEIKRELILGELSTFRKASLPIAAALGGMIVPAFLYAIINNDQESISGWGIPMATDIAFALGVLSLLGKRVPLSLKILLTALAVVDDLGAIFVIALFYTSHISLFYLGLSAAIVALLFILNYYRVNQLIWYILSGILLWYFIYLSGIHATISGVWQIQQLFCQVMFLRWSLLHSAWELLQD
jgi:NhaA family Na+:H+ antiporter